MDRRDFLASSLAAACSAALSRNAFAAVPARDEAAAARTLYDLVFERMLEASPQTATSLGLDTGARAAAASSRAGTAANAAPPSAAEQAAARLEARKSRRSISRLLSQRQRERLWVMKVGTLRGMRERPVFVRAGRRLDDGTQSDSQACLRRNPQRG